MRMGGLDCASLCLLCLSTDCQTKAMDRQSEAEYRALDTRCRLPTSPAYLPRSCSAQSGPPLRQPKRRSAQGKRAGRVRGS